MKVFKYFIMIERKIILILNKLGLSVRKSYKCIYNNQKLVVLLKKYLTEFFWVL